MDNLKQAVKFSPVIYISILFAHQHKKKLKLNYSEIVATITNELIMKYTLIKIYIMSKDKLSNVACW